MPETDISCIIIDDEEQAHVVLQLYITRLDFIKCKSAFLNAIDAYNYLRTEKVDLIFLDVNMPEVDGFSFINMLEHKPMVIITTAYLDHAYKSFEYNAIDYLYKPIRFERFVTAVEKACKWKEIQNTERVLEFITIKADGYHQQLAINEIEYIESLGNYIKIHCSKRTLTSFMTTKEIEQTLSAGAFIRIHKSFIVNTNKISEVNNDVVLIAGASLPIGKTYKKYIAHILK